MEKRIDEITTMFKESLAMIKPENKPEIQALARVIAKSIDEAANDHTTIGNVLCALWIIADITIGKDEKSIQ